MFCTNCGGKINKGEIFCSECGQKAEEIKVKMVKPKKIKEKKKLTKKQKTIFMISSIFILVIIVGLILFNIFYDFTKLNWDKDAIDNDVEYTESRVVALGVIAKDKKQNKINEINFEVSDGTVTKEGTTVKWKLPTIEGKYTITAIAPSGKKITKEIAVINLKEENKVLNGVYVEEVDDKITDNDSDGLTNFEEKELKTNMNSADTDGDGITDYSEINKTKTDPLKKDTDSDGINDGDELDLGLDPLKKDSKNDGINDGERNLEYTVKNEKTGVSIELSGKGNIASTTIDIIENSTFDSMSGVLSNIYNFYSNGTIKTAKVTIKYDVNEIARKGLKEDNLTLYYFDEETKELTPVPTTVDKENKTITVTLEHFSKYVIGDKDIILTDTNAQIMFVIDNSVSMYTYDQMVAADYTNITGATGNDSSFKRLSLTNKLIDMFTGNYEFGVAEFSGDYVNLKEFSDDAESVKETVDSMNTNFKVKLNGTNVVTALKSGINEFEIDENNHYMILLTDGKNTIGDLSSSKKEIISNAKKNNIKVCVIGLGKDLDNDILDDIAEETGCDYYPASDSDALDEIYALVGADINYNYVDTDGDNIADGMIEANSGFLVNRDGFNFANFSSNKSYDGHCYGMAAFAMLYYQDELPLSLEKEDTSTIFRKFSPSDGYDLDNTYFDNTDHSSNRLYDYEFDTEALNVYFNNPAGFRDRVEDSTWLIKQEYYDLLEKLDVTFITSDYNKGNTNFTKYQEAVINIETDEFEDSITEEENELLNSIWRLFIEQGKDKKLSFQSEPDKAFEALKEDLTNGVPVITIIDSKHAINSIKLIQDINDSNKFKIEVYDNNYPGETRYIDVTRTKTSFWELDFTAWTNDYNYTFMYDMNNDGTKENVTASVSHINLE